MTNLGVVAAIRAVGVRGDPCGAIRWKRFKIFHFLFLKIFNNRFFSFQHF